MNLRQRLSSLESRLERRRIEEQEKADATMLDAIVALERTGHDYVIVKLDGKYECLIGPEHRWFSELVLSNARARGVFLPVVIYAAINDLHNQGLGYDP